MILIEECTVASGYAEILPMLAAHQAEVGKFRDLSPIDPDLGRYQAAEEAGKLLAILARQDGITVGYSVNFLLLNLHYGTPYCSNDLLYVRPGMRKGRVGLRLISETVMRARARGARLMLWHAKEDTALNALLPRLGYEVLDVIHAKRI